MPVNAVNSTIDAKTRRNNNQPSFQGSFNPIVTMMDAIDKGGFAASFIAQDGIGMVAPRIYEGLNRNRPKDENGKKHGPLNWEFARREGIREVFSGPSAFLIPLGILSVIKKVSGTANNVHVNHISVLGQNFADYAAKNPSQIANSTEFKKGYYSKVFENVLSNSMENNLTAEEVQTKAREFAQKLVDAETKKTAKDKKGAAKLLEEIKQTYIDLRKSRTAPSNNEYGVVIKTSGENVLETNINRLTQSLTDYTGDALKKTAKFVNGGNVQELAQSGKLSDFIRKFNFHRSGTRVLSNLGMWGAVVAFYTLIPKLYNLGLKSDPGLKGLVKEDQAKDLSNNKDVSFTGGMATIGKAASKNGFISKILKNFEFSGATMPVSAMLTLLFGFCLPSRYANAKSDKERKEILVRDIASFTAILFGAKALSRAFSNIFAKTSGLALNITPKDHGKSIFYKIKNYFSAGNGIEVLSSEQIVSKYSKLETYKDGIKGFFHFIEENGGNVKKLLKMNKDVKANAETIVHTHTGKNLSQASFDEIINAFEKAKGSKELDAIYSSFESSNNKFINRAKTYNSTFGFVSTILLVPIFMMWLARYCEKMTKKAIEKENQQKLQAEKSEIKPNQDVILTDKPTMAGFLKNS